MTLLPGSRGADTMKQLECIGMKRMSHEIQGKQRSGSDRCSFENFIVGENSKSAFWALFNIATCPIGGGPPIFIWGETGAGKSHLLLAMRNRLEKDYPDLNVVFINYYRQICNVFSNTNEVETSKFCEKYSYYDIVVMDNFQFWAYKKSIWHWINTMWSRGKQVILSADRSPRECLFGPQDVNYEDIRIEYIRPPGFDVRLEIVHQKATRMNFDLHDTVAIFLAQHLKGNFFQLEGAVNKLFATYLLEGTNPTIDDVQCVIREISKPM